MFKNPRGAAPLRSFWEVLKWRLTARPVPWPERLHDLLTPELPRVELGGLAATFVGHDTFLLQFPGLNVLTDPVWSERASPFSFAGPRRVRLPALAFDQLPPIDLVLISHNHYDHLDRATLARLAAHNPIVVMPLANSRTLAGLGLRIVELNWWESFAIPGLRITLTPAQHWSNRFVDRNRALWGGFFLNSDSPSLYFAGDTGYQQPMFQEIRERLGTPDVSLLPVGTYEPRWFMHPQHMNPDDAVRAHIDLGSHRSLGMHFGTFHLSDEAIEAPLLELDEALARHRASNFQVPRFGETFAL